MAIYLAPMQGVFNTHYRKVFAQHFTGIDKCFTPFIVTHGEDIYTERAFREISIEATLPTIPQVMGNHPERLLVLCRKLQDLGTKEINLNMGCPQGTATSRKMGSGLLPHPEMTDQILEKLFSNLTARLSVKTRIGLHDPKEFEQIVPVLNRYPLSEIIIHPRVGKQLYRGEADREAYRHFATELKAPLVYNGDIVRWDDPIIKENTVMIGRGIAQNPFLAESIATGKETFDKIRLKNFHHALLEEYSLSYTGGEKQILLKMKELWEYFYVSFPDKPKLGKSFKKCQNMKTYTSLVQSIFC
ncbi:MAG: tRNA-dihydrouridine synthase family protein [Bacteroidales bacterium]|nr:tRNA-dihydrouridine synthase family protein [Bacteroidales bacterium]